MLVVDSSLTDAARDQIHQTDAQWYTLDAYNSQTHETSSADEQETTDARDGEEWLIWLRRTTKACELAVGCMALVRTQPDDAANYLRAWR